MISFFVFKNVISFSISKTASFLFIIPEIWICLTYLISLLKIYVIYYPIIFDAPFEEFDRAEIIEIKKIFIESGLNVTLF